MIKHSRKIICLLLLLSMAPAISFATEGIGDVAANMAVPVDIAGHLLADTALLAGLVSLIASVFRYMQYRKNELAHPLSTAVTLFIMGVVFILFPIIYHANEQPEPGEESTILNHQPPAQPAVNSPPSSAVSGAVH